MLTFYSVYCFYIAAQQCSPLDPPRGNGFQQCFNRSLVSEPYSSCSIGCSRLDGKLVEDTPKYFTCGPGARWNSVEYSGNLYPTCGRMSLPDFVFVVVFCVCF